MTRQENGVRQQKCHTTFIEKIFIEHNIYELIRIKNDDDGLQNQKHS